jgi:hypothetical protein
MKIATFNINGVNRRLPNLLDWLAEAEPDVVYLQELKATDRQFPRAAVEDAGYGAVGTVSRHGMVLLSSARNAKPVLTRTDPYGASRQRERQRRPLYRGGGEWHSYRVTVCAELARSSLRGVALSLRNTPALRARQRHVGGRRKTRSASDGDSVAGKQSDGEPQVGSLTVVPASAQMQASVGMGQEDSSSSVERVEMRTHSAMRCRPGMPVRLSVAGEITSALQADPWPSNGRPRQPSVIPFGSSLAAILRAALSEAPFRSQAALVPHLRHLSPS